MRIATLLLLIAAPCQAGTFVGQAWMQFTAANGTLPRVPVEVLMTTDYSTLTWELSWDVPETTVVGGPGENFETSFGTSGRAYLAAPLKLGLPNQSGTVSGISRNVTYDADFFGTSRVVTRNETWSANRNITVGAVSLAQQLNVADYPDHLHLIVPTGIYLSVPATTTDGNSVSLSGVLYREEAGFQAGIDWDFTEVLPGDFNSDTQVDAADYTVARDVVYPLTALLTSDAVWRDNYGATAGAADIATIPEPTTATLLILGVMGVASRRTARR